MNADKNMNADKYDLIIYNLTKDDIDRIKNAVLPILKVYETRIRKANSEDCYRKR